MVIDNEPTQEAVKPSQTNYQDSTKQNLLQVLSLADDNTTIVADNIESVNKVANRINDIVHITTVVEGKINSMIDKTYNLGTDSAVTIINKGLTTFTTSVLANINKCVSLTNQIVSLSNMSDTLLAIEGLETELKRIDTNLNVINDVGAAIDNVNIVASLHSVLNTIVGIQIQIIEIYNRMTELKTIYEYLPELLQIYDWIMHYKTVQADLGFTDNTFYQTMMKLSNNVEGLLELNGKIDDVLSLKQMLDDAPNLVANIKKELDALQTQYTANLNDDLIQYKRELTNYVTDQLMAFIRTYVANAGSGSGSGGGGTTVVGNTTAEVLAAIKQGVGIVLTRDLTGNTLTINIDESSVSGKSEVSNFDITSSWDVTDSGSTLDSSAAPEINGWSVTSGWADSGSSDSDSGDTIDNWDTTGGWTE